MAADIYFLQIYLGKYEKFKVCFEDGYSCQMINCCNEGNVKYNFTVPLTLNVLSKWSS